MDSLQHSETKQELLENTINHFNSTNRSVTPVGYGCKYRTRDGKGCAIGRELDEKLANSLDKLPSSVVKNETVFNLLPQRLKDMGKISYMTFRYFMIYQEVGMNLA